MDNKQKLEHLQEELKKYEEKLKHMAMEYAQSREGSRYGVEYYDIQTRVYQSMIEDIKVEINRLKKLRLLLSLPTVVVTH